MFEGMSPLWELVIGILIAVVGISVVPWLTSAATSWLEQRRGDRRHRRELYERWQLASRRDEYHDGDIRDTHREFNEARLLLDSQFGPRDAEVRRAVPESWWPMMNPEQRQIFRWWALGYHRQARRAARRLNRAKAPTD